MRASTKFFVDSQQIVRQIKVWITAARPRTLTASIIPILVGTAIARVTTYQTDWVVAGLTLLCAVFIQIGINFFNDAYDFHRGADNEKRIGFKRAVQSGLLSAQDVIKAGFIFFSLALLCGIPLAFVGGGLFVLVLLTSIIFGYLYTGGPYPLAYWGLGDIFAFFFFGLVCTITPFYLQTGFLNSMIMLAGVQIGCLATAMIATNNLRDIETDEESGKQTLAVLMGQSFARCEIAILSFLPFLLGLYWSRYGYSLATLLPCLPLSMVYQNVKSIWKEEPSAKYNLFFCRTALIHLLFGVFLTLGVLL